MYLTSYLRKHFTYTIQRGSYKYQRKMQIETITPNAVAATVRAGRLLQVNLVRQADQLLAECTCSKFASKGVCEHLWALIVEAEQRGALRDEGANDPVELVKWDFKEKGRHLGPTVAVELAAIVRPDKWKKQLGELGAKPAQPTRREAWAATNQLLYVIDVATTLQGKGIYLELFYRHVKKNGEWSKVKNSSFHRSVLSQLPDPDDRFVLSMLMGAPADYSSYAYTSYNDDYVRQTRYRLVETQPEILLPLICRTGRCYLRMKPPANANQNDINDWLPIAWEDGEPWQFRVVVEPAGNGYDVRGQLIRGDERLPVTEPVLLTDAGVFFTRERAMRYDHGGAFDWAMLLRKHKELKVSPEMRAEFLGAVLQKPTLPPLDLPEDLSYQTVQIAPRPQLKIKPPDKGSWNYQERERLRGELSFAYGDETIPASAPNRGSYHAETRTFFLRDEAAEAEATQRLSELGWQQQPPDYHHKTPRWLLPQNKLPRVVRELLGEGWHVEAEGKVYRHAGAINIQVSSGIDWFDLHGTVEFDGITASLPALLAALKRGDNFVSLGDGTFGLLPEEWLKKYGLLAGIGETEGDKLRFKRSQIGVLDALLASQPEASFDETFAHARKALQDFAGIKPAEQPEGFVGELRGYQKEGLGWMDFLQQFGFGGCLADDMGVGKTPQVLALLETRRQFREKATERQGDKATQSSKTSGKPKARKGKSASPPVSPSPSPPIPPSLVVVPKSLVFNWQQEAARFTPKLRVLDHTGQLRQKGQTEHFDEYDVILTTYGTLRNDVVDFKDTRFDYVVLDEAQAIKNADSVSAKAARLLTGNHRLAMSGTPIENHLGELWSLFEFLNPGMLGAASVFKLTGAGARNPDEETRRLLAHALRPFILRRTKDQVAKDLPAKLEQTLYCELEPQQRKLYNELRDHYRVTLLDRIATEGIAKAKIQVLEALLRLRQAAIHPGLIDPKRNNQDSAKLDLLLDQLDEVMEGDHKALVFSQFTTMLGILRDRLDKKGIVYEYLDGRTRDRQARVERFQNDPGCKVFLISLKAGGVGLNLTAAEYVFLLDPWWNPAVEMQAIDRAHRIGQERQVFAYRLIARDTVEEKVLQLQSSKRNLADAIISADNSLIRDLGREDLELLLS
ncbi:MAG: DEAD/DEAH box helicase [Acidobacteriota bacterium]